MARPVPEILDTEVAVIGGGIVGLGIAFEARRAGHAVTVIDPEPVGGATFAAAGMLAPVSELHYQEEDLLELMLASAARWPDFVEPLLAPGFPDTGFRTTPTLVLGADAADRAALADLRDVQLRHGLGVEQLGTRAARAAEPLVGPHISCAYRVAQDHQVDPRGVAAAILAFLGEDVLVRSAAVGLLHEKAGDTQSTVTGVVLADGREVRAPLDLQVTADLQAPAERVREQARLLDLVGHVLEDVVAPAVDVHEAVEGDIPAGMAGCHLG